MQSLLKIGLLIASVSHTYSRDIVGQDFYPDLHSQSEVQMFLRSRIPWGGDIVVDSPTAAIMNAFYYDYTFERCIRDLNNGTFIRKRVIFVVESQVVLEMMIPYLDVQNVFVIILLRIVIGPNGDYPKFGELSEVRELLRKVPGQVMFGIGWTSKINMPQQGYTRAQVMRLSMAQATLGSRFVLLEFDLEHLSKTSLDNLYTEDLAYTYILLRSAGWGSETRTRMWPIQMLMKLTTLSHWIVDATDTTRNKILSNCTRCGVSLMVGLVVILNLIIKVKFM